MDLRATLLRLDATLRAAGIPIEGVGGGPPPAPVTVTPPEAQTQAQPVIDAFDWSDAAQAAWATQQALAGVPARMQEISDLTASIRLVGIYNAQQINALVQWINGTLLPALSTAGVDLPSYAIPADITTVAPSPCTVEDALRQAQLVLANRASWLTIKPS